MRVRESVCVSMREGVCLREWVDRKHAAMIV